MIPSLSCCYVRFRIGNRLDLRKPRAGMLVIVLLFFQIAAAQTHLVDEPPGRVDLGSIQRVSYLDPGCGLEPGCGVGFAESSCGCETPCDCPLEPSCGIGGCDASGCDVIGCDAIGCDAIGCGPGGCDACDPGVRCFIDGLFPRLSVQWDRFEFFGGVMGFTGPMNFANTSGTGVDRRGVGSFGFYEGFNKGNSLRFFETDLAAQYGVRFTQANLSGAGFTDETRQQAFITSGVFRRVDYGLQYGMVIDHLYDDWYYRGNVSQIRGELSWVTKRSHVLGLRYAAGIDDDSSLTTVTDLTGAVIRNNVQFEAMNQYRLFYRQRMAQCGMLEGYAGWTDNDDGLLGMNLDLPIHGNLMWNSSATYLIPNDGTASDGFIQEGWNISLGITFRPGGLRGQSRHNRPLFKVADNGSLMLDRN
ncbi:MAG: DUF6666 family protein [Planctomycetota bacterium]